MHTCVCMHVCRYVHYILFVYVKKYSSISSLFTQLRRKKNAFTAQINSIIDQVCAVFLQGQYVINS